MTTTIQDLWNGNLAPADRCGVEDPEVRELFRLMEKNRDGLNKLLTAEQQAVFGKYIDCGDELLLRLMEHAFCDGFCMASRLLTEGLS